ncbi:cellulose synthase/poly-beta-1,6-N-acetylglucosamine synthase-like glycosyltransferase [Mariniflexile fucanivorans]|uniref:Cellulose synthase/poly-beta-1,6-N-acetylglucosamine synthase-like glycosyltransferase n=1 Tax=Mariniflexile fucanivorans TaxID=264023 RepID=A0A4V2QEN4_9FLAO|nr:glycosyltransferase [Mariniflexile fucanivorans]TCL68737.1 cellulose synthase/poly-beta-1,6-N-acetylglucosamine synthase-like glycosyltransferase [Mariniflexile fucanivorans]
MVLISIIISVLYLFLIGSFAFGFDKVTLFKLEDVPAKTKFSVVIPFRNEAENLPALLKTMYALNYSKELFEVIFVDDESEDDSVEIIENSIKERSFDYSQGNIQVILNERKTNSPKKDAISTAIKQANHEWIITTDADCLVPKYWLDSFDEYIQKNDANCIAAPVTYIIKNAFLDRFQLLDLLSLQGATIGGFGINKPFLCNGANFAYTKALFNELNGFDGNTETASGDDIFMLEKAAKTHPNQLHYLKCEFATVFTKTQPTWNALLSQRVRWAAKTSAYNNWFGKFTGLVVLFMNALVIALLMLTIIGTFNLKIFIYLVIIKFNIDFFLIYKSALFFNQKGVLKSFIVSFIYYPFFCSYVAFISLFSSYKWKGRTFKK